MSKVVEHLIELTAYRDRDVVDVTLIGALRELVDPLSIAIHRCIGEAQEAHWLTRAILKGDETVSTADPLGSELEDLPRLNDYPARLECMNSRSVVAVSGDPCITLFPLANGAEMSGVLEIHTAQPLAPMLRRTVSSVLRVYHNFQELLDYSERDTLTGLLNRKTFDESFLKATMPVASGTDGRRHWSATASYWLGVIDIDHFKSVNDKFGHLIGDEVLLLLARLMRASFRTHDRLYRFGGEEFLVLMRCEDAAAAANALERLRFNTAHYAFPQVGSITVSIGYSQVRSNDTPSAAFERADKAVYHAKEHGRNQLSSYADLVAQGYFKEDLAKDADVELF